MKVLISDIAKKAGVSSGTVSNALNNRKGISEEKKQAIIQIATDMGYFRQKENRESRELKIRLVILNNQRNVVGDTPFFSELIRGIEMECRSLGYELSINHVDMGADDDLADVLNQEASGVLVLGTELEKDDLEKFSQLNKPVVFLDTVFRTQQHDFVAINNADSAYEIVELLIRNGHKKIGIINSAFQINNFRERKQGFIQAINDYGLIFYEEMEALVEPTLEGAYHDMKNFLAACLAEKATLPTAFFAVNDNIAIGAMRAIEEYGLKEELSIVGFDDIPLSEFCNPPLTTIKVDKVNLGKQGIQRLIFKIDGQTSSSLKILVGTSIVERQSVQEISAD
ncbi:LacI family DNA-binding transcriptional regulator [Enterococcus sp. LJL120]